MSNPTQPPPYVQYHIRSGFLRIVGDSGEDFGVFSAQPLLGKRFPSVVLMHDWLGLDSQMRLLTDQLAQAGFVVITPDLFDGQTASTPQEAQALLKTFSERRADQRLHDALDVLKKSHTTSQRIGVIGVGLGGNFALKAAVNDVSIHAAALCSGFPQRWLGQLGGEKPPILALFGALDPLIPSNIIDALRTELGVPHSVISLPGLGHNLWPENPTPLQEESSQLALRHVAHFFHTTLG
jgi:carboxymethylenebutenolidase